MPSFTFALLDASLYKSMYYSAHILFVCLLLEGNWNLATEMLLVVLRKQCQLPYLIYVQCKATTSVA